MAKKRPSLENYLKTGKVLWEEEPPSKKTEAQDSDLTEDITDSPEVLESPKEEHSSPVSHESTQEESGSSLDVPDDHEKKKSFSEEEMLILGMFSEGERDLWTSLFEQRPSSFMPLNVMEQRRAFREGKHKKGALYKLRRRGHVLEEVQEEREIAFPLLALIEESEDLISVWCSQLK